MPPLNKTFMVTIAEARFKASAPPAIAPKPTIASTMLRTPLSMPQSMVRKEGTFDASAMIEPLCRVVCQGHDQWRLRASFQNITINAVTALGGELDGPALEPLIRQWLPTMGAGDAALKYGEAIAAALGEAWGEYQRSFKVPGLPWYPSFAAFPGPQAPPTPNVPTPLVACTNNPSLIAAETLKDRMNLKFGVADANSARVFDAIATGFQTAVTSWLPAQMVMQVMGTGPVPTFAPPYVPVGSVMGGFVLKTGGHLMS